MQRAGPFAGITVIDLTRVLAGPFCTMVLSDLGARVIKVERPETGDDARAIGPFLEDESGTHRKSAYFTSVNRGKQSIALDLKEAADREVFERLLARADVLVENFRPGAMERLGYGWPKLHERFPELIYAAASGFGHSGPRAQQPAYDLVVQALGGIMSLTGEPGGKPTRVGTSVGDLTAGLFTAIGIAAALFDRERNGEAGKIDVAMLDSQVAILENAIARHLTTGEVPGPIGARHPSITPFAAFETADAPLVIAAGNDGLFQRLCNVLGRPELAERSEFASNDDRTVNEAALHREIEELLRRADRDVWLTRLEAAGIPCGPIQNVAEVLADPQVRARKMVIATRDPAVGRIEMAGNPIKLSRHSDPIERPPAPDLDADRARILAELDSEEPR
jgi:CoA:oxalate CoA-transferase